MSQQQKLKIVKEQVKHDLGTWKIKKWSGLFHVDKYNVCIIFIYSQPKRTYAYLQHNIWQLLLQIQCPLIF